MKKEENHHRFMRVSVSEGVVYFEKSLIGGIVTNSTARYDASYKTVVRKCLFRKV
jgi:hypothetical protein